MGVKVKPLAPGDMVLRKVVSIAWNPSWGKPRPNWEGPYRITLVAGINAYFLEDLEENIVPRSWNVIISEDITINERQCCHLLV